MAKRKPKAGSKAAGGASGALVGYEARLWQMVDALCVYDPCCGSSGMFGVLDEKKHRSGSI